MIATDHVFPRVPVRQWVLSFPFPLRYLMASNSKVLSKVLAITLRAITGWIRRKVKATGEIEAILRFLTRLTNQLIPPSRGSFT